ncbi:hypothetical protein LTR48_004218 [Friedmanniomyces endolithicus]|uniref:FAD-binding domain-containing protein n=1 Tax=Rachicladosporium monterosium TaxID=1507873 RepID=A0ABR0L5W7_9PEZI|nr:hypothetical protein LTR48_004218 [Friedmanniomyces endolithicus]KAK5144024.1 hypothetical protein LTR32_003972 [Rachicladosporium monterosium]
MSPSTPNVLISGSGIAGSVFAFWLLRAYPCAQITMVERSPSLRLTGASVDIRSSAVDIIQYMGLEAEIRRNCTGEKGLSFVAVRSPKLHVGRVVLLGDAGYATPGIGTSLAITGGYVLAGELLRHPDDFGAALREYEGLMQPFVRNHDGVGEQAMQYLNPQTVRGIAVRDAYLRVMGLVMWSGVGQLIMMVVAWLGWKEKKLAMPAYPWPAVKG